MGHIRVYPTDGNSDNKARRGHSLAADFRFTYCILVLSAKEQEMLPHLFVHLTVSQECLIL